MRSQQAISRHRIVFVTGTDTGVGKTVVSVLLARHLRARGLATAALKPISSGRRDDARALRAAQGGELGLADINPWHFRAALAPVLAARKEGRQVKFREVIRHVRAHALQSELVVVEGAGGLLSPLGEGFDARRLITALPAVPVVVCPNQLGAINQVRLVQAALPPARARELVVVLSPARTQDRSASSNARLLAEFVSERRIVALPRIRRPLSPGAALEPGVVRAMVRLASLAAGGWRRRSSGASSPSDLGFGG